MCGIAGIAGLNANGVRLDTVRRMAALLVHRGPDDEGYYLSSESNPSSRLSVSLGHRRLSIIDIEGGHQPMSNEDKTVWIVYNGEIYNFPELRQGLAAEGVKFFTKSDTEVILRLYEKLGIDCVRSLRGMFAFCIWDTRRQKIFLARDRVGKKPLFYWSGNGMLVFASEIKSILEHELVKREVDIESLDLYLTYGYAPSPRTMFRGIKELKPAHYLVYDGRDIKSERYWSLSFKKKEAISFKEAEERLRGVLGEAVRMRLISDVPLGAFLSGGVDSSCVVALMSKWSSGSVKTFSIGFDEADFDELGYARSIAERFGTKHEELVVRPKALEVLPKLAWYYDQPIGDSSCIPTYYVSKMTREYVKVALNGDGGDESFAGYHRYRGIRLAARLKDMPKGLIAAGAGAAEFIGRRIVSELRSSVVNHTRRFFEPLVAGDDLKKIYIAWLNYFTPEDKAGLYTECMSSSLADKSAERYLCDIIDSSDAADITEKIMHADIQSYLPEDLLVKADRATMANSLEGRSPFLDHKVMEFAASLPIDYKLRGLTAKYILKKSFEKEIPMAFLNRKKKGFGVPVGRWFTGELKDFVKEMLLDRSSLKRGLFSEEFIERLLAEHEEKKRDHTHRIWALLSFEMWHRIFIEKRKI